MTDSELIAELEEDNLRLQVLVEEQQLNAKRWVKLVELSESGNCDHAARWLDHAYWTHTKLVDAIDAQLEG